MRKRRKGSLYSTLLMLTVVPIIVLGIVITVFSSNAFSMALNHQVKSELSNISYVLLNTFDNMYPGDYKDTGVGEMLISKGEHILNGDYDYIDHIKEDTGIDVTIFYADKRVITTVRNEDGERCIGTNPNPLVVKEVLNGQQKKFYTNTIINGAKYYAYYVPIYNSSETCVGIIGLAKPSESVQSAQMKAIIPIIIISLIGMVIMGLICASFSEKIVNVIKKLQKSMLNVANGDLSEKPDFSVVSRDDEIGDMGRSVVDMQSAIRVLVEQDELTHIYNRRLGEQKLIQIQSKAAQKEESFILVIGDIDFFKRVNDTYGHDCGDIVLKSIADILRKFMQTKGIVARWGGEEFLLVFNRVSYNTCIEYMNQLLEEISQLKVLYKDAVMNVTMTFGMAEGSGHSNLNELFKIADDRLYQGKLDGRNRVIYR